MELWIRSQSKEKLVKIENVYISNEIRDGRAIMGCNSVFMNQDLGTYATKGRALEILDNISKCVEKAMFHTEISNEVIFYQMPKE